MDVIFEEMCTFIQEQIYQQVWETVFEDIFGSCLPSKSVNESETVSSLSNSMQVLNELDKIERLAIYRKNNRMKRCIYKDRKVISIHHAVNRRYHDYLTVYSTNRMVFHFNYPNAEVQMELKDTAERIIAPGKSIVTVDVSVNSMGKRLQKVGVQNNAENRKRFRELFFTTDPIIGEYISGVFMFPETFYEKTFNGVPFVDLLRQRNILVGIKLDKGVIPLFHLSDELTTQGLDDLDYRCAQYKKDGCHFAKWRCVFKIGQNIPSPQGIYENVHVLARYSSICQAHGIVPVVEIRILTVGSHSYLESQKVTEQVVAAVIKALSDHHVFLEGILIKIGICTPGVQCPNIATVSPEKIGTATLTAFQRTIPPAVAGIAISSDDHNEKEALLYLKAINKINTRKPWPLTFCYGIALQTSVLEAWLGLPDNVKSAQKELIKRAKSNSLSSIKRHERASLASQIETLTS